MAIPPPRRPVVRDSGVHYVGWFRCWLVSLFDDAPISGSCFVWVHNLVATIQLIVVSVAIAGILGLVTAWAASMLEPAGRWARKLFVASMVGALAMPLILHAAAWEATAGKFGWLPLTQTGSRSFGAFGGLVAAGWIHGLVGTAIVALATWYGTGAAPRSVLEQSRLDTGPVGAWWRLRLPMAMPWLVASLLGVAALAATEMTVVDLYGFRTLADEFYLFYAADPTTASVVMTCVMPTAIGGLFMLSLAAMRRRLITTASYQRASAIVEPPPRYVRWSAIVVTTAVSLLVVLIPVIGLVIKAGHQVQVINETVSVSWSLQRCWETLRSAPLLFADEYRWTILLAMLAGALAMALAWPLAAWGRTHRRAGRIIDAASLLLILVPGPVVGLAVVYLFQMDVPGFRALYQQTLVPTVLALQFRAAPAAYWIVRTGYRGIGDEVFWTAKLDVSWIRRVWWIDRPLLWRSLTAAFLASAVVASGDVPATLPVVPPGVSTVGTRLFGLLHSGARYQEASLALWYVGAVILIALLWLGRRSRRTC